MSKKDQEFESINKYVNKFEKMIKTPKKSGFKELYVGVDLGTACVTMVVLDENREPIAGCYEWADVVRDGMIVNYMGAIDILRKMKIKLENSLGVELIYASNAIPPGTEIIDHGVINNVVEGAGFISVGTFDEPTAANELLKIDNGAIVDIGGGTTGISIFENGKVVHVADEATGGTHFSLVVSGACDMPFDKAEEYKRIKKNHKKLLPVLTPVIEKVAHIINKNIEGYDVKKICMVGGSSCFTDIEKIIETNTGIKTVKPKNPLFITPIGIALSSPKATLVKD